MLSAALNGFVLGASLIIAIGAQNTLLLRYGLLRRHVLPLVLIGAVSDAILIALGVAGLGGLVAGNTTLLLLARWGGAAFLALYALLALRRAARPIAIRAEAAQNEPLRPVLMTMVAMTWLNPHVYLDTVVLLGSLAGQYENAERIAYGAGAISASFSWFFALGYGASLLTPVFAKPNAWRVLDASIAALMLIMAARLII